MGKRKRHQQTDNHSFVAFAKKATAGLDKSRSLIMVWDLVGNIRDLQWYAAALQIGASLMDGKPIAIIAPSGSVVPPKMVAAAAAVEYFTPGDAESAKAASARALARMTKLEVFQ